MPVNVLPFLRWIRFSNTPTAVADVVAGYALASAAFQPSWSLLGLAISSAALYSWGMALNDWYDQEEDREHSPERPLVSGAISPSAARAGLIALWSLAILAAGLAGWISISPTDLSAAPSPDVRWYWPLSMAIPLMLCIWLYDGPLKRSWTAPFLMGGCRGLNLLLGASLPTIAASGAAATAVAAGESSVAFPWGHWPLDIWLCAIAMTTYVTGITWYARSESTGPVRWHLWLGTGLMLTGIAILAVGLPLNGERPDFRADIGQWGRLQPWWPLAIGLLNFSVIRKAIAGVQQPTPTRVKRAIIAALGNLIFLNAAICLYAQPESWWIAVSVVALFVPIKLLRQAIPPT